MNILPQKAIPNTV